MRAQLLYAVGDLRLVDVPKPQVKADDVLVAVRACGVCPTDLRKFKTGNHGVPHWPFNMGHEWAGDVVEVGAEVERFQVGQRVAVCGYGAYTDLVAVPRAWWDVDRRMVVIPDTLSYEDATFMEPLADCIRAVEVQANARLGDTIVISGAGQMGLQQTMIAKAKGAKAIVIDVVDERLEAALRFGADAVVNARKEDPVAKVKELTGGQGAHAAVVSNRAPQAVEQAMQMVRKLGRVVLFAGFEYNTKVSFDPNIVHYNEVTLMGSYGVGLGQQRDLGLFERAVETLAAGSLPVSELVTHRFPLEQLREALDVVDRAAGLKVVITY